MDRLQNELRPSRYPTLADQVDQMHGEVVLNIKQMDGPRNQLSKIHQQANEDCGARKRKGNEFCALLKDIKKKNMILQHIITKSVDRSDLVMLQVIRTFERAGQTWLC